MLGILFVHANVSLSQSFLFPRTKELAAYQGRELVDPPGAYGVLYAPALQSRTASAPYNVLSLMPRHYGLGHLAGSIRTILPESVRKHNAHANHCRSVKRVLYLRTFQTSTRL